MCETTALTSVRQSLEESRQVSDTGNRTRTVRMSCHEGQHSIEIQSKEKPYRLQLLIKCISNVRLSSQCEDPDRTKEKRHEPLLPSRWNVFHPNDSSMVCIALRHNVANVTVFSSSSTYQPCVETPHRFFYAGTLSSSGHLWSAVSSNSRCLPHRCGRRLPSAMPNQLTSLLILKIIGD